MVVLAAAAVIGAAVSGGDDASQAAASVARPVEATPVSSPSARPASPAPEPSPPEEAELVDTVAKQIAAAPTPMMDGPAFDACSAFGNGIADVVTKQDRSDLARSVNLYARQSAEPQFVQAGIWLTDHADSWTGFMWSGMTANFADLCIRGGYEKHLAAAQAPAGPGPGPDSVDDGEYGTDDEYVLEDLPPEPEPVVEVAEPQPEPEPEPEPQPEPEPEPDDATWDDPVEEPSAGTGQG